MGYFIFLGPSWRVPTPAPISVGLVLCLLFFVRRFARTLLQTIPQRPDQGVGLGLSIWTLQLLTLVFFASFLEFGRNYDGWYALGCFFVASLMSVYYWMHD